MANVCTSLHYFCHCRADTWDPELKRYFPPPLELLLAFAMDFRSPVTLKNYYGYIKTGCMLAGAPVQVSTGMRDAWLPEPLRVKVFDHPALKRACQSVAKAGNYQRREKLFVTRLCWCSAGAAPTLAPGIHVGRCWRT